MTYDLSYTDSYGNDLCERYTVDYNQGMTSLVERLNELSRKGISFYLREVK
jgi:hypothetical protein